MIQYCRRRRTSFASPPFFDSGKGHLRTYVRGWSFPLSGDNRDWARHLICVERLRRKVLLAHGRWLELYHVMKFLFLSLFIFIVKRIIGGKNMKNWKRNWRTGDPKARQQNRLLRFDAVSISRRRRRSTTETSRTQKRQNCTFGHTRDPPNGR